MPKPPSCLLLSVLFAAGCAHQPTNETIPISGGGKITAHKVGNTYAQAENDRAVVIESGLTNYREGGKNYLRWLFTVALKQPSSLRAIRVEDVSGLAPFLLLEDSAPKLDGSEWSNQTGLTRATPQVVPWFFETDSTLRVFRFTITETDGRKTVLIQPALFTAKAKRDLRYQMGPELQFGS